MSKKYKPVVLLVLDGFGVNHNSPESTWSHTQMPTFHDIEKFYPFTTLQASGIAVGLPWGEEGNSEVGHLTIGAGRPLYHHLPRIIVSIHDGSFFQNPALQGAINTVKKNQSKLHVLGLFSSGSVHAYADHLYAILELAKRSDIPRVFLHLFTDGRDAPEKEAAGFIRQLEERIQKQYPHVQIASITGRFFAMDRDDHWDRIEKVYNCLAQGKGNILTKAPEYIESSYKKNIFDEFIEPAGLQNSHWHIEQGDALIFFNFREDSMRELVSSFITDDFEHFERKKIENLFVATMTEYDSAFRAYVAFPRLDISWPIARAVSEAHMTQLHIAETEKYAHVTYFFNGGKETPFPGEGRILIPSLPQARFDETPEMSAEKVTSAIIENIPKYDFILANFANGDMVGHTGNFSATAKAIEILDADVGKIIPKALEQNGVLIVTADHGNAEEKIYVSSGEKRTKHTINPVPFYIIAEDLKRTSPRSATEIAKRYNEVGGVITDVAPTLLALLGLPKPEEMTGVNLLPKIIG